MPTRPVVVAASDLDIGAELRREDIRIVDWPANALPANSISDPKDVVGRGLVLPVIENEPFLPMKLAAKDAGAGLPPVIPPGLRAVSVRVNEVIRVDVVATASPSGNGTDMTSKVILTNVQVLAAGTKIDRETDKNKPMPVSVVTLLVNPEESERITLASTEGKIQLALRNPLDKSIPQTPGVRPSALFGIAAPARTAVARTHTAAAPLATLTAKPVVLTVPEQPTVEIIRGDKRAHEAVRQE
jgi:pilus assembly protein CpaB